MTAFKQTLLLYNRRVKFIRGLVYILLDLLIISFFQEKCTQQLWLLNAYKIRDDDSFAVQKRVK